ncbi:MAG: DNA primase [Elusimicrobia bacterium]|nr:DNA primase [Elusimicrobiota bacterium]
MSIPETTIQNILNSIDIVEVIGESIRLTKSGRNFKARCPFHNEKTPSFHVSPEKQIFHCFGCNAGGNAISFVMKMEGLTYPEAIRKFAKKCGIEIKENLYEDDKQLKEREIIYKILEEAGVFYQKMLAESNAVKNWLKKRGISDESIKKYRLGYSPASSKTLFNEIVKRGYSPDIYYKTGLGSHGKDFFYNRIIFPIFDITGRIVAFGGRVFDNDNQPKYLNSPETTVYSKSGILYGLNFAGKSIKDANSVVILEGYIDVIMCHQFGLTNTVATLGTAFTSQHSSILKRYSDNVIIAYDPDMAGRSSALRSCEILLASDLYVKIAMLPDGKDSDEILLANGEDKLKDIFHNAKSYVNFLVDEKSNLYDIKTIEGKRDLSKLVLPVISKVPNEIVKSEYLKTLSERLSIKEEILNSEMSKIKQYKQYKNSTDSKDVVLINNISIVERNLISVLINNIKLIDYISDIIQAADNIIDDFGNIEVRKILNLLIEKRKNGYISITPAELIDLAGPSLISQILISDSNIASPEKFVKSYRDAVLCKRQKKSLEQIKVKDLTEFMEISKKLKGSKK